MILRKLFCVLLALMLSVCLTMSVYAVPQSDTAVHVQHILDYYRCYQGDASREIRAWLAGLEILDPKQSAAWEKILETWQWVDQDMQLHYGELPEGLPEDSTLGIAVLGYALNSDGSMRQELLDRLQVALRSAEKYPNAYIICTGGGTASNSDNTEAGVMGQWLVEQGIAPERVIVEANSLHTMHNAQLTYEILLDGYPQIQSVAVITSDYHLYRGVLYFSAVSDYQNAMNGTRTIPVVGSGCCETDYIGRESASLLADGLAMMAGITLDWQTQPALFAK